MDEGADEMSSFHGSDMMDEYQSVIKQEKDIYYGDTELQQGDMNDWSQAYVYAADDDGNQQNFKLSVVGEGVQTPYYHISYDLRKTKCLECGKILSGTRKANIQRHYKLVHKKNIKVGKEQRSSDDEYADQSSMNDTQKEAASDKGKNNDFEMDVKMGNELIVPDSVRSSKQDTTADQSDDRITNFEKCSNTVTYYKVLKELNKTECLECGKLLSGTRKLGIQRHYKQVHKKIIDYGREVSSSSDEDYEEPVAKKPTKAYSSLIIHIDESKFLRCCVGLVACGNVPLQVFDDRDFFKTLILPYEKKFGTDLNSKNILSLLDTSAKRIQSKIRRRIKNRLLSLKIDLATREEKSVIGINIQYLKDFKVRYNTLGVLELHKEHQYATLKDEIFKYLDAYKIDKSQIYSITADSGSYVIKPIGDLDEKYIEIPSQFHEQSKDRTREIDCTTFEEQICSSFSSMTPTRKCIGHTIHMAACDVIKELPEELTACREAIEQLKTLVGSTGESVKIPLHDNAFSWYSTYEFLKSLLNIKDYICAQNIKLNWDFVNNFVAAFNPLAKCAQHLQRDQYVAGDFYRDWFSCELELEDLYTSTPYAKPLHEAMQNKRRILFQNVAFTSALYLDPRFNFLNSVMLTEEQKFNAVDHLVKTFETIQNLENTQAPSEQPDNITEESHASADVPLDQPTTSGRPYAKMAKHIASLVAKTAKNYSSQRTIRQKLILLSNCKMVPIHTDILQHFKDTMLEPDISRIVDVVLAIPVNQISIEKTYSGLTVAIENKYKLNNTSLQASLMAKLNVRELNSKHLRLEYTET